MYIQKSYNHAKNAKDFTKNEENMLWHDKTIWGVRSKRIVKSHSLPEWEYLRELAHNIKSHTLANIAQYIEEFTINATKNGIKVHFAKDAMEHNRIAYEILKKSNVKKIVKSKSMLTEECSLNHYLEDRGLEVIDTDLGERIVQLRDEPPSHIVLPAVHLKKETLAHLFADHMGSDRNNSDATYLTNVARNALRKDFLSADAGITGVNFAIAETGGIVLCTNEGNADLSNSIAPIHIASMGMEKIIPKMQHLAVFTRLLARSATGQDITAYTSHIHKAKKDSEIHIIIVDNGRSKFLTDENFIEALNCIRCGSCLNTCPVYRRSSGHSYGYVIPGPIGSVLGSFRYPKKHKSLAYACSLCMSCDNICPVKINLSFLLNKSRERVYNKGLNVKYKISNSIMGFILQKPKLMDFLGKLVRIKLMFIPKFLIRLNPYSYLGRDLPKIKTSKSFKEIYVEKYNKDRS